MLQITPNVSPLLGETEEGLQVSAAGTWQDDFASYERHFIACCSMKQCIWIILQRQNI